MSVAPDGRKLLRIEARNSETPIERKPEWIKTRANMGPEYTKMRSLVNPKACILSVKKRHVQIFLNAGKTAKLPSLSVENSAHVVAISAISILVNLNR